MINFLNMVNKQKTKELPLPSPLYPTPPKETLFVSHLFHIILEQC